MTKYNTYTLRNGLRIIHLPSPSQVIYCGFQIAAGTRDEHDGEEGIAHFCEHMTFKGTERRNALQIINALEGVGGELNAFTNKEDTVYYAAIAKEHFKQAVDLLTDIVFHSQYPQEEIDKEVEVICDEIESYNDSPAELIYDEFESILFEGHPLGHNILGDADQLRTYTTDDALRFVGRNYRPEKMVFFAYGDVDFKRLCNLLSRKEGGARKDFSRKEEGVKSKENSAEGQNQPQVTPPSSKESPSSKGEITRDHGTHQAHVMIGTQAYPYNHPLRTALYLLNNILGGPSLNARLSLSLRERYGLVYTVESSMAVYSDRGLWSVYFGCDHHDVDKCRQLVRKELDKLMHKPLTQAQLTAAKRQIKGQIAIACDNREQFALDFGRSYLHHGQERDLDTLFAKIDAITSKDLQKVANELFAKERLTTLIFQ